MGNERRVRSVVVVAVAAAALAAAPRARADLDVPVGNGDRVSGTLDPGSEVESFRFACPRGALLSVAAQGRKSKGHAAPVVSFRVLDTTDTDVASGRVQASGAGAKLTNLALPASDAYRIEISGDGTAGDYQLSVKWKSPAKFAVAGDLSDLVEDLAFDAEAGSRVSVSLKPENGATAVPTLQDIRTAGGDLVHAFPPGTARSASKVALTQGGSLVLRVVAPGGTGGFTGTITVAPPKPTRRALRLAGRQVAAFQTLDAVGAIVDGTGAVLAPAQVPGASVAIPPGAFRAGTVVVAGSGVTLDPGNEDATPAGPAVYFGPDGLKFAKRTAATMTLPFDPAEFPDGLDELRVLTRDAKGRITEVGGVVADADAKSLSFSVAHFSAFQAFRVRQPTLRLLPRPIEGLAKFATGIEGDGTTVAVGTPYASDGRGAGAVFVYTRQVDDWTQQARIEPAGKDPTPQFGFSVALSGDTLAVGALGGAPTHGAVYVFTRKGAKWTQQAKLVPDTSTDGDEFGRSVSLDGDTLVVGAPKSDEFSSDEGAVYVFVRTGTTWTKQAALSASDGLPSDRFGFAVSLAGDTLAAGSPDRGGTDTGAVYVFDRSGDAWTQFGRLTASDAAGFARFGTSVRIDRTNPLRMAIGAPSAPQPGASGAGEAYVFSRGTTKWVEDAKLILADAKTGDQFGKSVGIDGGTVVIGVPTRNFARGGLDDSGSVVLYRLVADVWTLDSEFAATQTQFSDHFGASLSLHGARLFVGAPDASTATISDGEAYIFDVSEGD